MTNDKKPREISRNAAQFAATLRRLGVEGFAQWLAAVYGGDTPTFKPGAFFYDEPREFSAEFAELVREFDPIEREIATHGLLHALDAMANRERLHPLSIFALSRLTACTRAYGAIPRIAEFVQRMSSADYPQRLYVLALRDTLENVMRLVFASLQKTTNRQESVIRDSGSEIREYFSDIAAWSAMTLSEDGPRCKLVPAYAPLFFLALLDCYAFRELRYKDQTCIRYLRIIMKNFPKHQSWADDLAVYYSDDYPDENGTYNLDAIAGTYAGFVDAIVSAPIIPEAMPVDFPTSEEPPYRSTTESGFERADDGVAGADQLDVLETGIW